MGERLKEKGVSEEELLAALLELSSQEDYRQALTAGEINFENSGLFIFYQALKKTGALEREETIENLLTMLIAVE